MGARRMNPLTVVCLFVQGEYPYTPDYVTRLHAMVTRWSDRPFRFICLTDQPWSFQLPIETIAVKKLPGFAPWTKLELFNPARHWTGRMLYLDLDTLIVAPLAPIIDTPAPFAITNDPPTGHSTRTKDSFGREIVRRFNSSVMAWDGGTHTRLFTEWSPAIANVLSGDQDWIGRQLAHAATWPRAWFPRLSECHDGIPADAKVVLAKVPKNHVAVSDGRWPWIAPLWGAA
jgi:hypothetical protein